jgi:hypothetical protein
MAPKLAAMQIRLSLLFACLTLAGCVTFGRDDLRPENPTPAAWQGGADITDSATLVR